MDHDFAVRWVSLNVGRIRKYARKYKKYSPYDEEDYVSAANEAALIAAQRTDDAYTFSRMFWICFKDTLRSFVPNPGVPKWSASIPSYLCSPDIPTDIPQVRPDCLDFTTESIFISLRDYLPEKDWELLYLSSGLSLNGQMTPAEVGVKLGCSRQNVKNVLKRCLKDIQQLIESGKVSRKFVLQSEQPGENFVIPVSCQLFDKYLNYKG